MNLFKSNLQLPKHVFIVATGQNGREHYARIPVGSHVIAVNKGIIAYPRAKIWLCSDNTLPELDWWETADDNTSAFRIFSDRLIETTHKIADYTFDQDPVMCFHDYEPRRGSLRCGATVSAQALQFAYWFGAAHVTLVGVDMSGGTYFDGTHGKHHSEAEGAWNCINRFNSLILWLQEHGMIVDSLSKTALDVKVMADDE